MSFWKNWASCNDSYRAKELRQFNPYSVECFVFITSTRKMPIYLRYCAMHNLFEKLENAIHLIPWKWKGTEKKTNMWIMDDCERIICLVFNGLYESEEQIKLFGSNIHEVRIKLIAWILSLYGYHYMKLDFLVICIHICQQFVQRELIGCFNI